MGQLKFFGGLPKIVGRLITKLDDVQDSCCEISESVEEEFNIGLGEEMSGSLTWS